MGMVTIKCPITGRDVATGLVMTPAEFECAKLEANVLRCSACGRIHTWTRSDARLEEDPPERR
jgi:hypothetical protein